MTIIEKLLGLLTALIALFTVLPQLTSLLKSSSKGGRMEASEEMLLVQRSNIAEEGKASVVAALQIQLDALAEHRKKLVRLAWSLLVAGLAIATMFLLFSFAFQDEERLMAMLAKLDPISFGAGRVPEIARVYPDRTALDSGGSAEPVLKGAERSVDIVALTAYYFVSIHREDLMGLLRKPGMRVRILLMDEESPQFAKAADAIGHGGDQLITLQKHAKRVRKFLKEINTTVTTDRETYPGTLEARWFSEPLHYSLLLRDPGADSSMVQVGVYTYADFENRPYFRSSRYGHDLTATMRKDFEALWGRSQASDD